MKPEYENWISSYFNKEMDEKEQVAFEEACRQDVALRTALKTELKTRMAVHEYAKKERRSFYNKPQLINESEKQNRLVSWGAYLKVAAAFLAVFVFSYIAYQNLRPSNLSKVYERHFQAYVLSSERNVFSESESMTDSLWQLAGQAYQKGDWEGAKPALRDLSGNEDFAASNLTKLLLANIALTQDSTASAITLLQEVDRNNLTLKYDISWYLALAYLKSGDKGSALKELEELESSKVYGQRARGIKKQL